LMPTWTSGRAMSRQTRRQPGMPDFQQAKRYLHALEGKLKADELPLEEAEDLRQFNCLEAFGWDLRTYQTLPAEYVDRMLRLKRISAAIKPEQPPTPQS
jgi:hypothetical protein